MTYAEWREKFRPIDNHFRANGEEMFETFGEEVAFVKEQPDDRIWTLIDDEEGDTVIVKGWHFVNRLGYYVCEVPFTDDDPDQVDDD